MDRKQLITKNSDQQPPIGSDLESELELDYLLAIIVQMSRELLGASGGGIYLFNENEQKLRLEFHSGEESFLFRPRLRLGESLPGKVLQTKEPVIVENYAEWSERLFTVNDRSPQRVIGVPLVASNEKIGVLYLSYPDEGKHHFVDVVRAKAFGSVAALMLTLLAKGQLVKQIELIKEGPQQPLAETQMAETLRSKGEKTRQIKYSREEKLAAFRRLEGMLKTEGPPPTDEELKKDYINHLSEKYS